MVNIIIMSKILFVDGCSWRRLHVPGSVLCNSIFPNWRSLLPGYETKEMSKLWCHLWLKRTWLALPLDTVDQVFIDAIFWDQLIFIETFDEYNSEIHLSSSQLQILPCLELFLGNLSLYTSYPFPYCHTISLFII